MEHSLVLLRDAHLSCAPVSKMLALSEVQSHKKKYLAVPLPQKMLNLTHLPFFSHHLVSKYNTSHFRFFTSQIFNLNVKQYSDALLGVSILFHF